MIADFRVDFLSQRAKYFPFDSFKTRRECRDEKTNFDRYLEEHLRDPVFAARFKHAGDAWDVALQIAALRQAAG